MAGIALPVAGPRNPLLRMLASFLAAFFFALNATCASHSIRLIGSLRANLGRLTVAALALGLFAHTAGHGFSSASFGWFFLSGLIGMGLGDLGVYGALPLLGSRSGIAGGMGRPGNAPSWPIPPLTAKPRLV